MNHKWGYIDARGKKVISPRFGYVGDFAANGLATVMMNSSKRRVEPLATVQYQVWQRRGKKGSSLRYKVTAFRSGSSSFLPAQWQLTTAKRKIQGRVSDSVIRRARNDAPPRHCEGASCPRSNPDV
ncbi:MAG: WG repeat-containing protein [Zoogloeaceae bacterium]|nr:WG repeat-containing protein [Zoogloeaceae bacterium]